MVTQRNFKREGRLFAWSGLLINVILFSLSMGCANFSDKKAQPKWTGKPNLHQVRSAVLREKMRSMNALMFEYELDELRYDEQRSRQAASIAEIAGSMSESMNPSSVKQELGLDAEYAPVFFKLAQRLKKQALALHKAAQQEQTEAYPQLFRAMVKTCNECHGKFRERS